MELVKVTPEFYELCEKYGANKNRQLLVSEAGRPCVLVVSLVYRGEKRKFVVPMKSNIKNTYLCKIKKKIDENEKVIVTACQNYLERYASGKGMNYTPDIDKIIEILDDSNADTEEI